MRRSKGSCRDETMGKRCDKTLYTTGNHVA